jgi:hypothetical protein
LSVDLCNSSLSKKNSTFQFVSQFYFDADDGVNIEGKEIFAIPKHIGAILPVTFNSSDIYWNKDLIM